MILDAAAAKTLASIIVLHLYGPGTLNPQLPLEVEDRQTSWLVKGTPYTDERLQLRYVQFHIFLKKDDAAIIGYGNDGRQILTEAKARYWHSLMSQQEFDRIFGPATQFEPWRDANDTSRVLALSVVGEFLKTADTAADYASVLLQCSLSGARYLTRDNLSARRDKDVWHIHIIKAHAGFVEGIEIVTLSAKTGQILSGDI